MSERQATLHLRRIQKFLRASLTIGVPKQFYGPKREWLSARFLGVEIHQELSVNPGDSSQLFVRVLLPLLLVYKIQCFWQALLESSFSSLEQQSVIRY